MVWKPKSKRTWSDYARRLFHNVYNYSILGGAFAASALTGQWWLMATVLGAEALALIYLPDNQRLRNALDIGIDKEDLEARARDRETIISRLARHDQVRCQQLMSKQWEIRHLANENPTFSGELVRNELDKLDSLVTSFIDLAVTASRYREYLDREDIEEVERLARGYEREVESSEGHVQELARKNLAIVMSRLERLREIKEFTVRAAAQLELIENSFGLLADQIVSMRSPGELSHQLDELMDGVDAVRQTARESERLFLSETA